jgi:hypothetical protein
VKPDAEGGLAGELPDRPAPSSPIRELVAQVLKQHGIGGDSRLRKVVAAWRDAAGAEFFADSRVTGFKSGILTVEVDSAALLQELAVYRKRELLMALKEKEPGVVDVRFKPGSRPSRRSK